MTVRTEDKVSKRIGIFLDSKKIPNEIPPYLDSWEIVKSIEEFVAAVSDYFEDNGKLPELISLDHDITDEHITSEIIRPVGAPIFYSKYKTFTGFHAAQWLVEYCEEKDLDIIRICVHSQNPMGSLNIQTVLGEYIKKRGIGVCFTFKWK